MSRVRLGGGLRLSLGSLLLVSAMPAHTEIGATVTLASEDRFRGYSVSRGYPAATLSLSYDDAAGPYVEGSVMIAGNPSEGIRRSRFEANAGYAQRLKSGPTLDAGVMHAEYGGYRIYGARAVFTEVYAGMISEYVSAHIHYSPRYFERGVSTFYAEADASGPLTPHIRLSGHYGLLFGVAGAPERVSGALPDWRIGAETDFRKLRFELALASRSRRRSFYGAAKKGRTALLASVAAAF